MTEPVVTAHAYARWRATTLGSITERVETNVVFDLIGPLQGRRVLDVGTGDGTYAIAAAARGAIVTAMDRDPGMLDAARSRAASRGVEVTLQQGRAEELPFDDASFDVVIAVTVLCFVADADVAVREMARVLVPGGCLVLGELGRFSVGRRSAASEAGSARAPGGARASGPAPTSRASRDARAFTCVTYEAPSSSRRAPWPPGSWLPWSAPHPSSCSGRGVPHARSEQTRARMTPSDPIYLDHNATTPLLPEVVDAMLPYLREHFGNPSSGHVYGTRARSAVARAREQVAALLGCDVDEVFFTSGGTEANNLAIRGVAEAFAGRSHIVTTVIEHPATARPCAWLEKHERRVTRVSVDADGRARMDEAQRAIDGNTALVTVMHSNNETGVMQPVAELAKLAHAVGAVVHTDAAQSLGKVPVNVRALEVDLLSVAGHKLYAPKGVGALYVKRGTSIVPFVLGASHERGLRPGTENVASIVGLGAACEAVGRDLHAASARMRVLRDTLWERLVKDIPGLVLNGHGELRLPNTLNVRFPGTSGSAVLAGTPEIAASTGSACHEGHESASAVILAMGVGPEDALGSIRLTLGRSTTADDVARAGDALVRAWRQVFRA